MHYYFIPFYGWIIFHYIDTLHFVYSSVNGHLGCFHWTILAIMNNVGMKFLCQPRVFNYLSYIPRNGTAVSNVNSMFNFLRNGQTFGHSGWTIFNSHQQCMRILANGAQMFNFNEIQFVGFLFGYLCFMVSFKKSFPTQGIIFPSKSFHGFSCYTRTLTHFELIFTPGVRWQFNFILFHVYIQLFPTSFVEKTNLSPLNGLGNLVKINWPQVYEFTSGLPILLHWPVNVCASITLSQEFYTATSTEITKK